MMSQVIFAIDINKVLDFLREALTPVDNILENIEKRDTICIETRASLLIEANCTVSLM